MRRFVAPACLVLLVLLCGAWVQYPDSSGNPHWGLRRIAQRRLSPLDANYSYFAAGVGVNIYIVGTGVYSGHDEFKDPQGQSRVTYIGDFCTGAQRLDTAEVDRGDGYDGHDTHVASYAAGKLSGVAKGAHIYSLRTTWEVANDGNGGTACSDGSAVAAAFNWIRDNGVGPAVVNYSGGRGIPIVQTAILNMINKTGFLVTLSGDTGGLVTDPNNWGSEVPTKALVVGGTDMNDNALNQRHPYGSALGLYAPAKGLVGAGKSGLYNVPEAQGPFTPGDSWAAPFVAGAAALYLEWHPTTTARDLRAVIVDLATPRVVNQPRGEAAPNRLLFLPFPRMNIVTGVEDFRRTASEVTAQVNYRAQCVQDHPQGAVALVAADCARFKTHLDVETPKQRHEMRENLAHLAVAIGTAERTALEGVR